MVNNIKCFACQSEELHKDLKQFIEEKNKATGNNRYYCSTACMAKQHSREYDVFFGEVFDPTGLTNSELIKEIHFWTGVGLCWFCEMPHSQISNLGYFNFCGKCAKKWELRKELKRRLEACKDELETNEIINLLNQKTD